MTDLPAEHNVMESIPVGGGERRQVSVMFCDLVGSTKLSNSIDAEDLRDIIATYQALCQKVITRQKGFIARYSGDGILTYFGYPKAQGDDAIRAVQSGLDIIEQVEHLHGKNSDSFQVRIGIATGIAIIGDVIGEGVSREVSVVGETPNIAARLQSLAKPNELVIGPTTQRLVNRVFHLEEMGRRQLKGIVGDVSIWRVQTGSQSSGSSPSTIIERLTEFSARESELERMENAFDKIRLGEVQVVDLPGEAGIGKSRLVHEFRIKQNNQSTIFWEGRCTSADQLRPYRPFIQCLRQQLSVQAGTAAASIKQVLEKHLMTLGTSSENILPYLLNLLDAEYKPRELSGVAEDVFGNRTDEALTSFILAKAQFTPLVLTIEDIHWVDSASERLLKKLIGLKEKLPLLILCTYRSEYSPPWSGEKNSTKVIVPPLSRNETTQFVQRYFDGNQIDGEFVDSIVKKSDGNPLFIEEIINNLLSRDLIDQKDPSGVIRLTHSVDSDIPETLQYLLLSRIDHLDYDNREVLQVASVIGRQFPTALLSAVTHLDQRKTEEFYADACTEQNIINCDHITEVAECKFRHALIQETLYSSLLRDRRKQLHQAVGEAIEGIYSNIIHEWVEPLAHHFSQTHKLKKTVKYLTLAAEKDLDVYSLKEAEIRFQQVLTIIDSAPKDVRQSYLPRTILGWMKLKHFNSSFRETMQFGEKYTRVLKQYGTDRDVSIYSFWLGYAQLQCGALEQARDLFKEGLRIAEEIGDMECIAYTTAGMAWLTWVSRRNQSYDAVPLLCSRALEITRSQNIPYIATLTKLCLGVDRASRGLSFESRGIGMELVSSGRSNKDSFAVAGGLQLMAWADVSDEEYDSCIQNAEEALLISPTPIESLSARGAIGAAKALQGQSDEGYKLIKSVRDEANDMGVFTVLLGVEIPFGAAIALKGDISKGVDWIEKQISKYQIMENDGMPIVGHIVLGEIYLGMLTREQKLPIRVMLRNIGFLLRSLPFAAKKAREHFVAAEDLARSNHAPGFLARSLINLTHLDIQTKRYESARRKLSEVKSLAPQVRSKILNAKIAMLEETFAAHL